MKLVLLKACYLTRLVAPHAGAWIEISSGLLWYFLPTSLPTRERGLKWPGDALRQAEVRVAPHAGAWIEIVVGMPVVNLVGSLPTRERGLKLLS